MFSVLLLAVPVLIPFPVLYVIVLSDSPSCPFFFFFGWQVVACVTLVLFLDLIGRALAANGCN